MRNALKVSVILARLEKVRNSSFDTDTIWAKQGTSTIANGAANIPDASNVQQSIATIVGRSYTIRAIVSTPSNKFVLRVGSTPAGFDLLNAGYLTTGGEKVYQFTAVGATSYITALNDLTPSATLVLDSISVR